jgi:hypothetical protein
VELSEIMKKLPTNADIAVFDHGDACGFVVSWSEAGYGFGEFTFFLDKATGEFHGDTECTDPDHVGRILMSLVGSTVRKP